MASSMAARRFNLQGHTVQRLAAPVRVRTDSGLLWITVDGEAEDILLEPGQCRRFERDAPVVVYALGGDAAFSTGAASAAPARAAWPRRLAAWLRDGRAALGAVLGSSAGGRA